MAEPKLTAYEHLSSEVWQRLAAAADRKDHSLRLITLASVDQRDQPDARILVLRGVEPVHGRLWFYSDSRAEKIAQLRRRPAVCLVAYDIPDGVQLRMTGCSRIHTNDVVVVRHWEQLDLATRYEYQVAPVPGSALNRNDPIRRHHHEQFEEGAMDSQQQNFAVIEVTIDFIDWLQVNVRGDRRARMSRDHDWVAHALAP